MLQKLLDEAVDEILGEYDRFGTIETRAVAKLRDGSSTTIKLETTGNLPDISSEEAPVSGEQPDAPPCDLNSQLEGVIPSSAAIAIAEHAQHSIPGVDDDLLQNYVQKVMDQSPGQDKVGGGLIWEDPGNGAVVAQDAKGGGTVFIPTNEATGVYDPTYFGRNIQR